jgi:hypothetical protein
MSTDPKNQDEIKDEELKNVSGGQDTTARPPAEASVTAFDGKPGGTDQETARPRGLDK